MNDKKRIEEIKERAEKATEGPWTFDEDRRITCDFKAKVSGIKCEVCSLYASEQPDGWKGMMDTADFIAESRSDIPWLLEQLENADEYEKQLNKQIADLERSIKECSDEELEQRKRAEEFQHERDEYVDDRDEWKVAAEKSEAELSEFKRLAGMSECVCIDECRIALYRAGKDAEARAEKLQAELTKMTEKGTNLCNFIGPRLIIIHDIKNALEKLCDRLVTIRAHPKYQRVWEIAQSHFGMYDGPTWEKEYDAARLLLSDLLLNEGESNMVPMTKKEIEKFARAIRMNFGSPFLEEGFVEVKIYDDHFNLRIGPRDVDFDSQLLVIGSGTDTSR